MTSVMLRLGGGYPLPMQHEDDPPWLHLLSPFDRRWREKERGKGRDPDSHIEKELRATGVWPMGDKAVDA